MTDELVYANITYVMEDERRKQTEQNLIRFGKAEFLSKGYAKANLRDICKAAGVTTGAFYFSFENKEALLAAILDPVIAEYRNMCSGLAKREEDDPGTAEDNERLMMEYLVRTPCGGDHTDGKIRGAVMRVSGSRSMHRCRRHLQVILQNLWVKALIRSL